MEKSIFLSFIFIFLNFKSAFANLAKYNSTNIDR